MLFQSSLKVYHMYFAVTIAVTRETDDPGSQAFLNLDCACGFLEVLYVPVGGGHASPW